MVHKKIFLADVEYNNEQNNSQTTEEQWLQYTSMKVKIPLASLVLDGFKSFRGFCALVTALNSLTTESSAAGKFMGKMNSLTTPLVATLMSSFSLLSKWSLGMTWPFSAAFFPTKPKQISMRVHSQ